MAGTVYHIMTNFDLCMCKSTCISPCVCVCVCMCVCVYVCDLLVFVGLLWVSSVYILHIHIATFYCMCTSHNACVTVECYSVQVNVYFPVCVCVCVCACMCVIYWTSVGVLCILYLAYTHIATFYCMYTSHNACVTCSRMLLCSVSLFQSAL